MLNSKTYEHQVIEEPEREDEAVDQDEEENSFNERTVPTPWPGSNVDARYRSYTTSTRDDLPVPQPNTLRPADVLRHRSQTTAAMAWNPSATAPLSSSSSVKDLNTKSNNFASSSIGRLANNSKPESSTDSNSQFHFSRMNNQPSTTSAAIVAAVTAASSNSTQQDQSSSTSKIYMTSSARRGSVPMQMHRLPASVPEDGAASDDSGRNDMIPLPQSGQMPANFVVFSDSRRESIFTRADDGQDMIPLDF